MRNEEFDNFEIKIKLIENNMLQAYLPELPQISEISSSGVHAVSKLYVRWQKYKKECKNIPVPTSKQQFSGQFNTRVEASLHHALVMEATECGLSLNALVSKKLRDSVKKPNQPFEICTIELERSVRRRTLTLFFANSFDEKVGLTFAESNLGDELRNLGGDKISDKELIDCFSSSPLKEAVQNFLSSQSFQHLTHSRITVIDCLLVSHESIGHAVHGTGLNKFPNNPHDFLICRLDI